MLANILSALAIGIIISIMAAVKSPRLKAFIYSLPIPITIALFATGGHVNTTHIVGLVMVTGFLWLVYGLTRRGVNVYAADVVAAGLYVAAGLFTTKMASIPFIIAAGAFAAFWLLFVIIYRTPRAHDPVNTSSRIKPIVKLPIVSAFAYVLLSLKSFLSAGVIVTFPFSGVFAVIESRQTLRTLAATFSHNSIAILGLFIAIHSMDSSHIVLKVIVGWAVYLLILRIVTAVLPLQAKS